VTDFKIVRELVTVVVDDGDTVIDPVLDTEELSVIVDEIEGLELGDVKAL